MTICTGAKMAANHRAIDSERRAPATFSGGSLHGAQDHPGRHAGDREGRRQIAAMTMWA